MNRRHARTTFDVSPDPRRHESFAGRTPPRHAAARRRFPGLAVLLLAASASAADPSMIPLIDGVFSYARSQEANTVAYLQAVYGSNYLTTYPRSTSRTSGKWTSVTASNTLAGWTAGFFPGSLWLTYQHTGDGNFLALAKAFTAGIEVAKDGIVGVSPSNPYDHDQGFRFISSFYTGHQVSNDTNDPGGTYREYAKGVLLTVAAGLDARFNMGGIPVGAIRAYDAYWEPPYPVEVDSFMNYPLLLEAWDLSGRPTSGPAKQWYDHAVAQANTQIEQNIRTFAADSPRAFDDGGTYHIIQHNDGTVVGGRLLPADGAVYNQYNDQGYGAETTWTRGQAWAMYGLTETYRFTRGDASVDPNHFLDAARRTCDYFISHLPNNNVADPYNHVDGDFVPPTDFEAALGEANGPWNGASRTNLPTGVARAGTHTYTFRDSSAAAAGASALLALSTLDPDPVLAQKYFDAAEDILRCLMTFDGGDGTLDYLAMDTNQMGILAEAAGGYSATDTGTSWSFADYYFLEALQRYEDIVVPEPATASLMLAGAALLWRRKKR